MLAIIFVLCCNTAMKIRLALIALLLLLEGG